MLQKRQSTFQQPYLHEPKREEISPDIFLTTVTHDDPVEIVYSLDIKKNTLVLFNADFTGSSNLMLQSGGLRKSTTVRPYSSAVVATLRTVNPDVAVGWKLVCRYNWEEEDQDYDSSVNRHGNDDDDDGDGDDLIEEE